MVHWQDRRPGVAGGLSKSTTIVCAICGSAFDPALSTAMPFCSDRCRNIDLSRWLSEGYGLPWDPPQDEDELLDE